MSALLESLLAPEATHEEPAADPTAIPDDSPYRIVLARLRRLVEYRESVTGRLASDASASAELARVAVMIGEVHRAVSMAPEARALAARIDGRA